MKSKMNRIQSRVKTEFMRLAVHAAIIDCLHAAESSEVWDLLVL